METRKIFKNCNYTEADYKYCISKYLERHVGFIVNQENVNYKKISIDEVDYFVVILKDDIRRIAKENGGSGVLRQKQWSIFVFNFINYEMYKDYFGINKNKKPICSPFNQQNMDFFEYEKNFSTYNGKNPEYLYKNASIFYLIHNYIYSRLRNRFRCLFLNSYVYSVVGIINPKPVYFSTYYYNTNHKFKVVPDRNHVINQKVDINRTTSLISDIEIELESIDKNYLDMSSLVNAYLGNLPLNPVTSVNYENIIKDITEHENYIITEGTARTGKTIIAMRLLGRYSCSRLIIMNELFYKSLVEIFKIEGVEFPVNRIICHTKFDRMAEWASNSEILVVDEAQRLNSDQINKLLIDNKNNVNVLLGDNLQAINWKSDKGIEKIEEKLIEKKTHYKKYYFDHSIGISSNVLYAIKYLIYNNVSFNYQSINNYDINIFSDENDFIQKYREDSTYRKHMATIYMGRYDYNVTITSFDRWHVNKIRNYPYFLDNDIKSSVMLTTYELISRELDSVYVYIPDSIYADSKGLHFSDSSLDSFLLNQLYVLLTRAKGEINIFCSNLSTYNYLNQRNQKIIKNEIISSTLLKEEKQKGIQLENKIYERGITRLIHFTPEENLESILKYGIMSIKTMKEKNISYISNDNKRYDNVLDGISLSVQNPNNYLLNRYKNNYNGRKYVCLILDPALLYEITDESGEKLASRIYFNYNAAAISSERSEDNFDIMFKDSFWAGSWINTHHFSRNGKEDNETTANQAEVIFRETIDPKYILEIKEI